MELEEYKIGLVKIGLPRHQLWIANVEQSYKSNTLSFQFAQSYL